MILISHDDDDDDTWWWIVTKKLWWKECYDIGAVKWLMMIYRWYRLVIEL